MRRLAVAVCLLGLPAAGACGGGDQTAAARKAASGYVAALGRRDGAGACGRMTKNLQRQFLAAVARADAQLGRLPCANAMTAALRTIPDDQLKRFAQAKIQNLKLDGDRGSFRYTLGTIRVNGQVAKESGAWKVSCCVPGAG